MDFLKIMQQNKPYVSGYKDMPNELQEKAKKLCWQYNRFSPDDVESKNEVLDELLGDKGQAVIENNFHCDYGFNIHFSGFALINYNCTILDSSPVKIGNGVFVAPGVCLACSGHALDPTQRAQGIGTSAPITIKEGAWIGANVTVLGGVTIGSGSVIGAGSVVTKDIPENVIALGTPCKVQRKLTEADKIRFTH